MVYHGGTTLANFITLVNPDAIKKSGGVKMGYIYFIARASEHHHLRDHNLARIVNNAFAFADTSTLLLHRPATANNIDFITMDSAGNLYLSMGNAASNANEATQWTTVINTQGAHRPSSSTQCSRGTCTSWATATRPRPAHASPSSIYPWAKAPMARSIGLTFGGGQYIGGSVDGYGNFYQNMGSGSGPGTPRSGLRPG